MRIILTKPQLQILRVLHERNAPVNRNDHALTHRAGSNFTLLAMHGCINRIQEPGQLGMSYEITSLGREFLGVGRGDLSEASRKANTKVPPRETPLQRLVVMALRGAHVQEQEPDELLITITTVPREEVQRRFTVAAEIMQCKIYFVPVSATQFKVVLT